MKNVKNFFEALASDMALQEKAMALNEKYKGQESDAAAMEKLAAEELVSFAAEAGFPFTMEEFKAYREQSNAPQKLSDDEMDAVVGGGTGGCGCVLAGGGGGDDDEGDTFGCACVAYGQGGDAKNDHMVCICAVGGMGDC